MSFGVFPGWARSELDISKVLIEAIMTEMLAVICKVGQGVVDLAYQ